MSTDLVVAGVLVAVAALMLLSHVLRVPYPILLVLGGCLRIERDLDLEWQRL